MPSSHLCAELQFGSPAAKPEWREPSTLRDVADFHRLFKAPVLSEPTIPNAKRCALRVSLLQEELNELKEAIAQEDLVEVADALADIAYVLSGAVHEFNLGSRFADLFDEVQRSNMSKACSSLEEAEATVSHYARLGQPARIEQVGDKWLVYRTADSKVYAATASAPKHSTHNHQTHRRCLRCSSRWITRRPSWRPSSAWARRTRRRTRTRTKGAAARGSRRASSATRNDKSAA